MTHTFKPGDVALCTLDDTLVLKAPEGNFWWVSGEGLRRIDPDDLRPVAVIDPENREQVERLLNNYYGIRKVSPHAVVEMQAVLHELAKPKPPEPTGHLAVVEDSVGVRWVNWRDPRDKGEHERPWVNTQDGEEAFEYRHIDVVRVVWAGVE